jgi:hypothetical protein
MLSKDKRQEVSEKFSVQASKHFTNSLQSHQHDAHLNHRIWLKPAQPSQTRERQLTGSRPE